MKILFFIDRMIAGGKERRLTELMKILRKTNQVDFQLAVMDNEIHYKEVLDLGIPIHFLIRKTKKDFSIFKKFYQICKAYQPDIVHCWDSMTAVYSYPAWKLLGFKLVNGMVVDTLVNQHVFNKQYIRARLSVRIGDIVIGNSKAGLASYGVHTKKWMCIYNGMDLARFQNLRNRNEMKQELYGQNMPNLFITGMVAAFENRKDYHTFINAAIPLAKKFPLIRFMLVGEGSNLQQIKNLIPGDLKSKFLFTGKQRDVEQLVNTFDVAVLLTNSAVHGEGISNSIIEYMALSKPVIATTGGGTNEVVFDGENGFLIKANDANTLEEKITLLYNTPNLGDSMGKKGRAIVEEKFEISIMSKQYIDMYRTLLDKNENA